MKPSATGATYLNFIGNEGRDRVVGGVEPENYRRLAAVKAVYDPETPSTSTTTSCRDSLRRSQVLQAGFRCAPLRQGNLRLVRGVLAMSRGKFGLASAIAAGVLVLGFAAPASAWTVERVDLAGYAWEVEPGHGMATLRLTPPAEGPAAGAPAGAPLAMTCTAIGVGTIVVQSLDHTPPVRFGGPIQVLPRDLIEFLRLKEERRIDLPHPALYEPQVLPGDAPRTLVYSASWSPVDRLLETLARDDADAVELAVPYARMRLPVDGRDTALAAFGEACAAILAPPHH